MSDDEAEEIEEEEGVYLGVSSLFFRRKQILGI